MELIEAFMHWFLELGMLGKLALIIGVTAPLFTLNTHLNPPSKPKPKPDGYVEIDGKKANIYLKKKK